MKRRRKYNKEYQELLKHYELPLVYHFANEVKSNSNASVVRLVPSKFYQSDESYAYHQNKPISKIL
jgi:hypothetical protein